RSKDKAAKHVFGLQTSLRLGLVRLMSLTFVLSAFFNNTPIVALLIPITGDWARTRGFSPSKFLMPLSFSCIFGGVMTVIGTSTNLLISGLVIDEAAHDRRIRGAIGFFEPGYIGFPLAIVGMLYLVLVSPLVLPDDATDGATGASHGSGGCREEEYLTEVRLTDKFEHLGQPVAAVLARVGLPTETLVKIRRTIIPDDSVHTAQDHSSPPEDVSSTTLVSSSPVLKVAHAAVGMDHDTADLCAIESASPSLGAITPPGSKSTGHLGNRKRLGAIWPSSSNSTTVYGSPRVQARNNRTTIIAASTGSSSASSWGGDRPVAGNSPNADHRCARDSADGHSARSRSSRSRSSRSPLRSHVDICPVSPAETVREGDVLLLSCPRDRMADFQGLILSQGAQGLEILDDSAVDASQRGGTAIFEVVLSESNSCGENSPLSGVDGRHRHASRVSSCFNCGVLAIRHDSRSEDGDDGKEITTSPIFTNSRNSNNSAVGAHGVMARKRRHKGGYSQVAADVEGSSHVQSDARFVGTGVKGCSTEPGGYREGGGGGSGADGDGGRGDYADEAEVMRRPLASGDFVLVLADDDFMRRWKDSDEFDLVSRVASLPKPVQKYDYLALLVFCGMLGWVLCSSVIMVRAAMAAGGVLIIGGWVDARKAVGYVDWALLLLVGSALGLSKAISNSGLADYAGEAIKDSGMSASASIFVLYGFTMV
ncbi:unnamed protein product, partial [Sphacelaria rigidula]